MPESDDYDDAHRYQTPYNARHQIPTIAKFRRELQERRDQASNNELNASDDAVAPEGAAAQGGPQPMDTQAAQKKEEDAPESAEKDEEQQMQDTSQVDTAATDPRQRMKLSKAKKRERAQRQVTDPVTHLPIVIQDFTDEALENLDYNKSPDGSDMATATGVKAKRKTDDQLRGEEDSAKLSHRSLINRFPPPDFDALRGEISTVSMQGAAVGITGTFAIMSLAIYFGGSQQTGHGSGKLWALLTVAIAASIAAMVLGVRSWTAKQIDKVFQNEVWEAQRQQMNKDVQEHETETTMWLNSLIGSVWPIINPDLFASLSDTLEDVMQASLPGLVRMVSVDDVGQGSESIRLLGIRWLPTGAAAEAVTEDGSLTSEKRQEESAGGDQETEEIKEGMEAEDGDFVNMEVAFAYRTRAGSKSLKERSKDMHLFLAFYLPGNIKIPVWVNLQGIIGTMRMRLQLTPDPPFFALCTLTFLGQPKVDLKCVPLSKHGLNIMDIPLISNFVQSAVDAAMAQYVAPKSLTLDLKDMLAGEDFKKDTVANGVLMIHIKRGYEFKMGDTSVPFFKDGGSDPYVSVGWAKFGKVIWSTRIMKSEMEPCWEETCFLVVTPEELNIEERLRIQLWDSDKFTADDDLGRIEVDLHEIMKSEESKGKMWHRTDGFRALKSGDNMPGKLEWSVGYYSKAKMQKCQFEKQTHDPEVRTMAQLRDKVDQSCERKLREAMFKDGVSKRDESELKQQKAQEFKAEQDSMMISAPPPDGYPSGIFSLQIHNITGLEIQKLSKDTGEIDGSASDEEESGESAPSAYCTILVNHRKTFKTRTKPQNAKPFFNAGCERFIRDWRDCEVHVSVRDARLHEDDPLIGIVHLPLSEVFKDSSQIMGFWPLSGGVGFGKVRLSMVWRSVELQAPRSLLGWQYGTMDIRSAVAGPDCSEELKSAKLKFRTNITSGKLYPRKGQEGEEAQWHAKRSDNLALAVHDRYSSCMSVIFRHKRVVGGEQASAFCVLWLKDLPDEEEQDIELPIWKGDVKRATSCCLDECGERVGTLKLNVNFWAGMVSRVPDEPPKTAIWLTSIPGHRALELGATHPEPPRSGRGHRHGPR